MPDRTPLPGVEIAVANRTATTDGQGVARVDALPEGTHELVARKAAHRSALASVAISAGGETVAEVVLAPEGNDQHAHEGGIFAHRDLYVFEGRFDCSATALIITGDCLLLVDNVTSTAGVPVLPGDATQERHVIDFPLDMGWAGLVVELVWDAQVPTEATGGSMQLALEPAEAPADGYAVKYARVVGGSPLRVEMVPGVKHATATQDDMPNPLGGEVIRARAFVAGLAHNPAGTPFLGVSAAAQHEFRLLVSIFYEEPAPAGYTAVAEVA